MREWYNVFNGEYKNTEEELGNLHETFNVEMRKSQLDVDALKKKFAHIYKLPEMMLDKYFNEIHSYITSMDDGQSAFSSLLGILSGTFI